MKATLILLAAVALGIAAGCGSPEGQVSDKVNVGTETPKPGEAAGVPDGEK